MEYNKGETGFVVFMFVILVLFSILGNFMVIYVIVKCRGLRTVTNYFLFNLSAGDLLTLFQIVPNVHYVLTRDWIFGLSLCKLSQFFTVFNIAISVFTFVGITADRYTAIMFPLRPRIRPRTAIFYIFVIWLAAFVVGLPSLIFANVEATPVLLRGRSSVKRNETQGDQNVTYPNADTTVNATQLEDTTRQCFLALHPKFDELYDYALFTLLYVLPLMVLAATYVPISLRLWFHRGIGEITRAQVESVRSKRRAVKMMCAVMCIFAICWFPYQVFFIILRVKPEFKRSPPAFTIFIACYWLAMSNAIYNPIIYFTMNRRFRNGLVNALSCFSCSKPAPSQVELNIMKDAQLSYPDPQGHLGSSNTVEHYPFSVVTSVN
ncbi:Tachykinin-like peptides receptor 99D [Clonorchis sinensis]|uniref:Tachykinin-like peptides receptor 99D n=1 Tax=Clonorchis sinensis TaxID=79923 RepID=A0A3R7CKR1_CLOSI|nr:Tachykinin-like peptides receptor 99D [Clonorchis sinensis]